MKTPVMLKYTRVSVLGLLLTLGNLVLGQTPTPTPLPTTTTTGQQNSNSTSTTPFGRIDRLCAPYIVQNNVNGANVWNRSWAEYKAGFSTPAGDFWIGNERLYQLTANDRFKLRIEMQSADSNNWYWAEYRSVMVAGEIRKYALYVAGFTTNTAYNALDYQESMMFSTYDRDNDEHASYNCAAAAGGGFWYRACEHWNLNAPLGGNFQWYYLYTSGSYTKLKSSRMLLVC